MLIIQGTSLALKWKAINFTLEIYFQLCLLKDTSSLGERREGGRGETMELSFFCFSFNNEAFFSRFDVFNTVFVRAIFLFLAPLKTFRRGSDRKESRAKEIIKVYTFHLWFLSNPKTYFISKKGLINSLVMFFF